MPPAAELLAAAITIGLFLLIRSTLQNAAERDDNIRITDMEYVICSHARRT